MRESRLRKSAVYGLEVLGSVGQVILVLIMIREVQYFFEHFRIRELSDLFSLDK
jgi:hypothetical protein